MNTKFFKIYFALFLMLFVVTNVSLAFESELLSFEELPGLKSNCTNGSFNYKFVVTNKTNERMKIDVNLVSKERRYQNESQLSVAKKIELEAHGRREDFILYPFVNFHNAEIKVKLYADGRLIYDSPILGYDIPSYSLRESKCILIDRKINNTEIDKLIHATDSSGNDYQSRSWSATSYESNLDSMDTNWVAYTRYNALMFYDYTIPQMPSAVQNAITDYVRAGGTLIIIGENHGIKKFDSLSFESGKIGYYSIRKLDFGKIIICRKDFFECLETPEKKEKESRNSSSRWDARRKVNNINTDKDKNISVGNSNIKKNNNPVKGSLLNGLNVLNQFNLENHPFGENYYNNPDKNDLASVALSEYLSGKTMPLIVTILVIVISLTLGPVNFFVLWRKNKKIFVYITVPVFAFIFCLGIAIYYWLFEANKLFIYRNSFTYLTEDDNSAVTFGSISAFSGKKRDNAFTFPVASVFYFPNKFYQRNSFDRTIVLDNMQTLANNWMLGRIPFSVISNSISRTRARIDIKPKNQNEIEILNGLGADIKRIYIFMPDGNAIFMGNDVDAGAVKTCENIRKIEYSKIKNYPESGFQRLRKNVDIKKVIKQSDSQYTLDNLQPGEYIAYLKSDPFMNQKIDKEAVVKDLECVVVGKIGSEATK